MKITKGADNIAIYNKTTQSVRKWCKTCGGHVFTDHPAVALIDVYAAVIPDLNSRPALHVHYGETRLRIKYGLPKMKDVPKEFHGFGEVLPE